jgi:hypothetical protein
MRTDSAEGRDMTGLIFCATAVLFMCGQLLWATYQHWVILNHPEQYLGITESLCEQERAIVPINHSDIWNYTLNESKTEKHRLKVVEWLRGAVKIPYVCLQFDLRDRLIEQVGNPQDGVL